MNGNPAEVARPAEGDGKDAAELQSTHTEIATPYGNADTMKPVIVSAPFYKAYLSPLEIKMRDLYEKLVARFEFGPFVPGLKGLSVETSTRIPIPPEDDVFSSRIVIAEDPDSWDWLPFTDLLFSDPQFGNVARIGAEFPSYAGRKIAERGFGDGDAGMLVLLDGTPINDSFSGFTPWSAIPRIGSCLAGTRQHGDLVGSSAMPSFSQRFREDDWL
jgi:hypothetical protein